MASKSNSRDASAQESDMNAGTNAMADLARQQMASSATTACAVLRALDNFQQTQLHMIQRAALVQEQTADRLRGANSPAELMAIHFTVMLSGLSEMGQYAQELLLASLKAQNEFLKPAEQQQQLMAGSTASAGTAARHH